MKKEKLKFPKDFLWGSATSGPQTEGAFFEDGKGATIWDHWYKLEPERFFDRRNVANDFYHNYKQDLDIAKKLNFNSLRLSIQWARIFPKNENEVNPKGVEYYHKVFAYAKKIGLKIIVNLFHFDMPMWMMDKGGFESKDVIKNFATYAKFCVNEFPEIKNWTTMNEPIVPVEAGYWYAFFWPLEIHFEKSMRVIWNTNMAHLAAVSEMKKAMPDNKYGIIVSIEPATPRSNSVADLKAAHVCDLFKWRCFTDTMINKEFPEEVIQIAKKIKKWPSDLITKSDKELLKDKTNVIDFLGVNFYQPARVKALDYKPNFDQETVTPASHFFESYAMPGRRMNPYRGWEIHPKSVYKILTNFKKMYGNIPIFISENGMGVEGEEIYKKNGQIQDDYRIDFISEHLFWVHKAIEEGCNVFGYHMWTYIDNWSWANAYKNRYGFIELNLATGKRIEKRSASWIRKVIKDNSIEIDTLSVAGNIKK